MNYKPLPSVEVLRDLFDYDPETGVVTRKKTTSSNAKKGMKVGCPGGAGHLTVYLEGQNRHLHRVIWKMHTGYDPVDYEVDHRNGDPSDNSWRNLRVGSHQQNLGNLKLNKTNTSGYPGVRRCSTGPNWFASITYKGKSHYLGTFKTPEEASEVRQAKALELRGEWDRGFTPPLQKRPQE